LTKLISELNEIRSRCPSSPSPVLDAIPPGTNSIQLEMIPKDRDKCSFDRATNILRVNGCYEWAISARPLPAAGVSYWSIEVLEGGGLRGPRFSLSFEESLDKSDDPAIQVYLNQKLLSSRRLAILDSSEYWRVGDVGVFRYDPIGKSFAVHNSRFPHITFRCVYGTFSAAKFACFLAYSNTTLKVRAATVQEVSALEANLA
jgi:hypothetical protein